MDMDGMHGGWTDGLCFVSCHSKTSEIDIEKEQK